MIDHHQRQMIEGCISLSPTYIARGFCQEYLYLSWQQHIITSHDQKNHFHKGAGEGWYMEEGEKFKCNTNS